MAFYSTWDWNRNSWRVYATKTPVSVGDDPIPPRPRSASPIGADPDTGVKPLPSGAKFIGYSHVCRGEVRRLSRGMGDSGDDAGSKDGNGNDSSDRWTWIALGAAIGVGTVLFLRRFGS